MKKQTYIYPKKMNYINKNLSKAKERFTKDVSLEILKIMPLLVRIEEDKERLTGHLKRIFKQTESGRRRKLSFQSRIIAMAKLLEKYIKKDKE